MTRVGKFASATLAAFWGLASLAQPASDSYRIERLVPGSAFHGVHGLAFDAQDRLYAGSVVGESIYRVDTRTAAVATVVGPPQGMADDLVFLADGTMVWTAISQGVVRARRGDEPIREVARLTSINSIAVRKSDGRLFAAQVFGGDALWELDPSGVRPPRNIRKDLGGFNGFDVGPDGKLYGPLWFKKQVVRIDPDSGELVVIADGFGTPAAANFDSKWNLYVLDTARGEVVRVDIDSGSKRIIARLATSLDNLAIDSRDRVFVSNMADNAIHEVDVNSGTARQVVKGSLAIPLSIDAVSNGASDTLFVADVFAFRSVDARSGKVSDIARAHAAGSLIEYPIAVTTGPRHVVLLNSGGLLQQYDRDTLQLQKSLQVRGARNAIEDADGNLIVAAGSEVVLVSGADGAGKRVIAASLATPFGLARTGNTLYVSEAGTGNLLRVALDSVVKEVLATGLQRPHDIALDSRGDIVLVEMGARRLIRIDTQKGGVKEIARGLPIGMTDIPTATASVAVGARDVLYVTSDVENSIYRLTPK